eukprot:1156477-Pelagomonas_calceolata.AAC.2
MQESASELSCHALQTLTKVLFVGELLWARQCKAGGGESKPTGAWQTTRQTLSSCLPSAPSLVKARPMSHSGEAPASLLVSDLFLNARSRTWLALSFLFFMLCDRRSEHVSPAPNQPEYRAVKLHCCIRLQGQLSGNTSVRPGQKNAQLTKLGLERRDNKICVLRSGVFDSTR